MGWVIYICRGCDPLIFQPHLSPSLHELQTVPSAFDQLCAEAATSVQVAAAAQARPVTDVSSVCVC